MAEGHTHANTISEGAAPSAEAGGSMLRRATATTTSPAVDPVSAHDTDRFRTFSHPWSITELPPDRSGGPLDMLVHCT